MRRQSFRAVFYVISLCCRLNGQKIFACLKSDGLLFKQWFYGFEIESVFKLYDVIKGIFYVKSAMYDGHNQIFTTVYDVPAVVSKRIVPFATVKAIGLPFSSMTL